MSEIELPDPQEMQEMGEKKFGRRVALITAVFAVMLAITSLGGNNAMKEMMLAQQQASDQWAFYQAKSVREHLYRSSKMQLELDLMSRADTIKPEVQKQLESVLNKMGQEEARFQREKTEIEQEARRLEGERDKNRAKDPYFDYAEVLLQIAIVMASISILATSRMLFLFGLALAIMGSAFSINGFFLLFQIPFFH